MKLYLVYFICITIARGSIPDYFPQCKRSDPEIEKCVLDGVEAIKPRLKDGITEINLPPLDPFKMNLMNIDTAVTGATVKAIIRNIVARGGSNFKIESMKINLNNTYAGELKLIFPRLELSADYNTRGSRVLLFTIHGDGNFEGTFNNVDIVAKGVASPILRDGVEYLQLTSMTTQATIGDGDLNVIPRESTFTGRATSSFISWNPSVVLKVLRPVIDETTATIVKQYLDAVLATVPLNDFLVD